MNYYGFEGGGYGTTSSVTEKNLPSQGNYVFSQRASVKAEPRLSSPELAYYDTGSSVNYDSLINADGHYWLSYMSYSGARRYIAIN